MGKNSINNNPNHQKKPKGMISAFIRNASDTLKKAFASDYTEVTRVVAPFQSGVPSKEESNRLIEQGERMEAMTTLSDRSEKKEIAEKKTSLPDFINPEKVKQLTQEDVNRINAANQNGDVVAGESRKTINLRPGQESHIKESISV